LFENYENHLFCRFIFFGIKIFLEFLISPAGKPPYPILQESIAKAE